jgi:hypothetical protein
VERSAKQERVWTVEGLLRRYVTPETGFTEAEYLEKELDLQWIESSLLIISSFAFRMACDQCKGRQACPSMAIWCGEIWTWKCLLYRASSQPHTDSLE